MNPLLWLKRKLFGDGAKLAAVAAKDRRVRDAMDYARRVLGQSEPLPVRWFTMRGDYLSGEGMWCRKGAASGRQAGGRTEFRGDHSRVIVYTGPRGEQLELVWLHEAIHAVGPVEGHPDRFNGKKLKGVVPYWG